MSCGEKVQPKMKLDNNNFVCVQCSKWAICCVKTQTQCYRTANRSISYREYFPKRNFQNNTENEIRQ